MRGFVLCAVMVVGGHLSAGISIGGGGVGVGASLAGATSNAVVYTDSSGAVATSGNAIFDGTNLGVGVIRSTSTGTGLTIQTQDTSSGNAANLVIRAGDTTDLFVSGGNLTLASGDGFSDGVVKLLHGGTGGTAFLDTTGASLSLGGFGTTLVDSASVRFSGSNGIAISTAAVTQTGHKLLIRNAVGSFVVDSSTTTGAGTTQVGTNNPAVDPTTPAYWITVKKCNLSGTSCTTGYMPVWE